MASKKTAVKNVTESVVESPLVPMSQKELSELFHFKGTTERFKVRLNKNTMHRLRIYCVQEKLNIGATVNELIECLLENPELFNMK